MSADKEINLLQKIIQQDPDSAVCFHRGKTVTQAKLLAHALHVSKQLPDKSYAINLCRNRYLFSVAFIAVFIKKQINLLPPNQTANAVNRLKENYPQSYCLVDNPDSYCGNHFIVSDALPELAQLQEPVLPAFDAQRIISISFTSGSTGEPKAVKKTWWEFQKSAELAVQGLDIAGKKLNIVSTVPPQHMYGLETSVFWPLFANPVIFSDRPFFPEDIRRLVMSSTSPCLLISTPTHIKACVKADLPWNNIAMLLSSTAPMTINLAEKAEKSFNAPLYEIFGSTETMSYAFRRLIHSELWKPYQGIELSSQKNRVYASGGHLLEPVLLDDLFQIEDSGLFRVCGRSTDLIKIAGKRASLNELNSLINAIDGIEEAIFYQTKNERLAAFVVTRLDKNDILWKLKQSIDEVFLPRPLTIVNQLPRNEIGKIIKSGLERMSKDCDIA